MSKTNMTGMVMGIYDNIIYHYPESISYEQFKNMTFNERLPYMDVTSEISAERWEIYSKTIKANDLKEKQRTELNARVEHRTEIEKLNEIDELIRILEEPSSQNKITGTTGDLEEKKGMEDQNLMKSVSGEIPDVDVDKEEAGFMKYAGVAVLVAIIFLGMKYA
ncbi:hypothetical protein ES703_32180 [subsurface metagenome]